MILLRSLIYYGYLILSTFVYSFILVSTGWMLPFRIRARIANSWGRSNLTALRWICRLDYQLINWENLPNKNCIILAKHQSAWETISLRGLLPPEQAWVLKKELLSIPLFGRALKECGAIAIDRKQIAKSTRQVISQGKSALEAGRWVIIFPEGTRVAPGEQIKHGIGGALLAEKSGYPIVPIAHNAGTFWRRRDLKKLPGTIQVIVGKPIDPTGKRANQITEEVETWIEIQMNHLSGVNSNSASNI